MTIRAFRLKVTKTLKIPKEQQGSVRLWLRMPDGWTTEISLTENDSYDLSWWGLENGSEVILYVGASE